MSGNKSQKSQKGAPVTNRICNGAAPLEILISKRGISLYLSLIIVAILLAIALGLSTILFGQLKIIKGMGDSVIAFYAADAGIEQILMVRSDPPVGAGSAVTLPNDATYQVFVTRKGSVGCSADNFCIKSIGTYRETRRAIEITY